MSDFQTRLCPLLNAAAQWSPCYGSDQNGNPMRGTPCWDTGTCAAEGWAAHPAGMVWHWKYLEEVSQEKLRQPGGEAGGLPSVWTCGWGLGRGDGASCHLGYKPKLVLRNHAPTWVETVASGKTSTSSMTGLACISGKGTLFLGCMDKLHQTTHLLCTCVSEMECEMRLCHGVGKRSTWYRWQDAFC